MAISSKVQTADLLGSGSGDPVKWNIPRNQNGSLLPPPQSSTACTLALRARGEGFIEKAA